MEKGSRRGRRGRERRAARVYKGGGEQKKMVRGVSTPVPYPGQPTGPLPSKQESLDGYPFKSPGQKEKAAFRRSPPKPPPSQRPSSRGDRSPGHSPFCTKLAPLHPHCSPEGMDPQGTPQAFLSSSDAIPQQLAVRQMRLLMQFANPNPNAVAR